MNKKKRQLQSEKKINSNWILSQVCPNNNNHNHNHNHII